MTAFRNDPAEQERLDWRILQHGAIALYHRPAILTEDSAWLGRNGYRVYAFDCGAWDSPLAFHRDAKRVLGFPDYYGHNLASFIDELAELKVPDAGGCALQFRRYDAFATRERALAQTVLDVIETTSRGFLLTGRRFLALVQSDNPRISFARVGARPVNWNPREWLTESRVRTPSMRA